MSTRC